MPAEGRDSYELLISPDGPAFEEFYRIYENSLPSRERKSRRELATMVAEPEYTILLATRNGAVIGFSVLFAPVGGSFRLLEYMAVHAGYRGSGVGSDLFRRATGAARASGHAPPVLVEIDSPRQRSPDHASRRRRQAFYERLGCLRIEGLSYLLPLPGAGPPPQMELWVYFPSGVQPLRKSQLSHWLGVVYQRVYGRPPDDPRIRRMVEGLSDPVRLGRPTER